LICILYGCSVPVVLRRFEKTAEEMAKEKAEDEEDLAMQREAAAIKIQRGFKESLIRKKELRKRQMVKEKEEAIKRRQDKLDAGIASKDHQQLSNEVADLGEIDIATERVSKVNGTRPKAVTWPKDTPPERSKPRSNTVQPRQKKEEDSEQKEETKGIYYRFMGECYVHGYMDGEAIKYQNDHDIKAEVFELR